MGVIDVVDSLSVSSRVNLLYEVGYASARLTCHQWGDLGLP